jgi:D-alanyl-D-alanine carboxypeptidase (penicillin-binding protein 5/6)
MRFLRVVGVLLVIVIVLGIVQLVRPVPKPSVAVTAQSVRIGGKRPSLPWPASGEAAVAVQGIGQMGSYGGDQPVPIGSVAKVMTALIVLDKHPLVLGAQGPTLTLTAKDQAAYQAIASTAQSLVPVKAGEKLSEYQLLQALLIPSGNNIATILANWVGGSEGSFVRMMNAKAKQLGLSHTTYADASGLSQQTVSTAVDQLRLAEVAMQNPVFAQIVGQPQVDLPVAGLVYNYNKEVTHQGVIGVKTGSTLAAGGCFVVAANRNVAGRNMVVMAAVFGQSTAEPLALAITDGLNLVNSAAKQVHRVRIFQRGAQVASVTSAWQGTQPAVAAGGVQFLGWSGLIAHLRLKAPAPATPAAAGQRVGRLSVQLGGQSQNVGVRLVAPIAAPGLRWRLTRL